MTQKALLKRQAPQGGRKSSSNSFIRLLSSTIEMCGPEHRGPLEEAPLPGVPEGATEGRASAGSWG